MRSSVVALRSAVFAAVVCVCAAPARAADADADAYLQALITLRAVGGMASGVEAWCNQRRPDHRAAHRAALAGWRAANAQDEVDTRLAAARRVSKPLPAQAVDTAVHAKLEQQYPEPARACGDLQRTLASLLDVRKAYPNETRLALGSPPPAAAAVDAAKASAPALPKDRAAPAATASRDIAAETPRAASGKGLATADIAGVLHHGEGRSTVSGYKFVETAGPILLKNGKAYARAVAPEGIDVAKSQSAEPRAWGEWRQRGKSYEVRWPGGEWQAIKGTLQKPFAAGTRLEHAYTFHGFDGTVAFGGVARRTTYAFKADGGFEKLGFVQGASGSLSAPVYSSSTTTSSSGKGTRSVSSTSATDPAAGPGAAPNVNVRSDSAKNDGANHRGRWRLDGYTLEVTLDNGSVERTLVFPWGEGNGKVWLWGRTHSR